MRADGLLLPAVRPRTILGIDIAGRAEHDALQLARLYLLTASNTFPASKSRTLSLPRFRL